MVPNTKVKRVAHAVEQMVRRPGFNPVGMYSDTWPHKEAFWKLILGEQLQGRLGLFHFMQRIIRTMRQGHIDYHAAVKGLCKAVYRWERNSYDALVTAMKNGTIGDGKKKYTDLEITQMSYTKAFKTKYKKYLCWNSMVHRQ